MARANLRDVVQTSLTVACLVAVAGASTANAAACVADDFGLAVDSAGGALRSYNLETAPKLQARIKSLAAKKGWSETETEDTAIGYLQDERIAKLDETANTLLERIDTLGRLEPGLPVDCTKLDELKTSGIELLAVMKAKSTYLISKIDAEVAIEAAAAAKSQGARTAAAEAAPPTGPVSPADSTAPAKPPAGLKETLPATAPVAKKVAPNVGWNTTTAEEAKAATVPPAVGAPNTDVAILPPVSSVAPGGLRPSVPMTQPPPAAVFAADDAYTIEEIRDASRGFFGPISTGLAAVIEHGFRTTGRPTGYILGQEGGGAFLGGLRYGEGTLYVRTGGTQKIYWHGPSVGFDVGAAGARTMFLVYKMKQPEDLFRVFTGLDGSAFVVGGVGITLLGGGGMVLAPIRSGLGVRIGANIGYLRFTSKQTWNPF